MHHYYVFNNKVVNESACANEANVRFKQTGEKSWIHFHANSSRCDKRCYLAPKEKVSG